MAAESLLIQAKSAAQGLAKALDDVARSGARTTTQSSQTAQNWERAAKSARDAGTAARDFYMGSGFVHSAYGQGGPLSQHTTAPTWVRNFAEGIRYREERGMSFAPLQNTGLESGSPAGGGTGSTILAASMRTLMRFATPYAMWQGLTGGLPGQKPAEVANLATDRLLRSTDGFIDDFGTLKDALKDLADEANITNDRFGEMSLAVAKTAGNITGYEALTISKEGAEAGRGFGLEDQVIPQWLSEMRWNEAGNTKELLPLIGAAVAQAKMPGRSEELLRGILGYTEKMQASLTHNANLVGYTNAVANISDFAAQHGYPGMKGEGAMSVLERMDQAVKNPGDIAKDRFWYRFFAEEGITDPFEQEYLREGGIADKPYLIRKIMPRIEQYYGASRMGPRANLKAAANLLGLTMHQAEFIGDWSERGRTGAATDIFPWLKSKGYNAETVKPGAVADIGDLFAIATGEKAAGGDWQDLEGLGARYLNEKERTTLGPPNEKWVDAILAKLMTTGRDQTPSDEDRKRNEEAYRKVHFAGEQLNTSFNTLSKTVDEATLYVKRFGNMLGFNEWTPGDQESFDSFWKNNWWPKMGEIEKKLREDMAKKSKTGGLSNEPKSGESWSDWFGKQWTGLMTWGRPGGPGYRELKDYGSGSGGSTGEIPSLGKSASTSGYTVHRDIAEKLSFRKSLPYLGDIASAAAKYGVPPDILAGLLHHESGFDPSAVGASGEIGIGQLKPATGSMLGFSPDDLFDANKGINAAAAYLRMNYNTYGDWNLAVAGYNAGHNSNALKKGRIPNTNYKNSVFGNAKRFRGVFQRKPGETVSPTVTPTDPPPTPVPADGTGPTTGLWGWPGAGAGWMTPGPLFPLRAEIVVTQRTDTGEVYQQDKRLLAAASYPMPPHRTFENRA